MYLITVLPPNHPQQVQHLLLRLHLLRVPQPGRHGALLLRHEPVPRRPVARLRLQRCEVLPLWRGNKPHVQGISKVNIQIMIYENFTACHSCLHLISQNKWNKYGMQML